MRTDLIPPQHSGSGFFRWTMSDGDKPTFTATDGSWLLLIPVGYYTIFGLFILAVPFLALMPGQPKLTQKIWLQMFLMTWLFGALLFWLARIFWGGAEPYRLSLDLATRHYTLRKGFRGRVKVWMGTFEDIREVYLRKCGRPRGSDKYIYNVIISWKLSGQSTRLWTYSSKQADDPNPKLWAQIFCQELGVPFGGTLSGDIWQKWE